MKDYLGEYSKPEKAFGEVFSSTFTEFSVQSYSPAYPSTPEYGSLIAVNCETLLIVGLVYSSEVVSATVVASLPTPLRKTRREIQSMYPDLDSRLRDVYKAVSVGYYDGSRFWHDRPPRKPLVHDLAYLPDSQLIRDFHGTPPKLSYLPLIFASLPEREALMATRGLARYLAANFRAEDEREQLLRSGVESMQAWGYDADLIVVVSGILESMLG
ncbi:MAG: hypothetical protein DRN96_05065 [Thermoproteota archaeon]|nr:MAG: hypothetical protein DRN96_05065 [Candidatus Korarchaeota archaeon]RLG52446.1 MAG: hypothetical protein DRN99_07595 [Candidatus Korarchaeota archaeon]